MKDKWEVKVVNSTGGVVLARSCPRTKPDQEYVANAINEARANGSNVSDMEFYRIIEIRETQIEGGVVRHDVSLQKHEVEIPDPVKMVFEDVSKDGEG